MHDQRVSRQQPIRRPYIRIDKLFSLLRALDPPRIVREKPLPEDERRRYPSRRGRYLPAVRRMAHKNPIKR